MEILRTLFVTLLALGVLITIHEFGHFWVARRCGVKVLRFSIGFGKPLLKWTDKLNTEYVLAALPLGGYVKMLDEREGNVPDEDKHLTFNAQPVWQRMAIVAAGPIANFLLAIFFFWVLFLGGMSHFRPVITQILPESPASMAGLKVGEEITAVNGEKVISQQSLIQSLLDYYGEENKQLELETQRFEESFPRQSHEYQLSVSWPEKAGYEQAENPLDILGVQLYRPKIFLEIAKVLPKSAAANAGLQEGDQLLAVNGQAMNEWEAWVKVVRDNPNTALTIDVERNKQVLFLTLIPELVKQSGQAFGRAGVQPKVGAWPENMVIKEHYSVLTAWKPAAQKTWDMTVMTLSFLKKMVTGKLSFKQVGGPVTIFKQAGESSRMGWQPYLGLVALLSISLAVLNLLPIPVLDGGHLLFLSVEGVLRRPVPEVIQMAAYQIGAILVFSFMLFAIYNDLLRPW